MANPVGLTTMEFIAQYGTAPLAEDKKPTVKVDGCAGCGGIHRGLTARINCLETEVRRLRAANAKK